MQRCRWCGYWRTEVRCRRYADPHANGHCDSNGHGYAYSYSHAHTNGNCDCYAHIHAYGDSHRNRDGNSYTDSDHYNDTQTDTYPKRY